MTHYTWYSHESQYLNNLIASFTLLKISPCNLYDWLGYIDLSKRRVDPEDVAKCEERYNKAKAVHSVLRHVADMEGKSLEALYQTVGWPLYKKYGHAYDAFKLALKWELLNLFVIS